MKLIGDFKFCGVEVGTTKAGKDYYVIGLLQGIESSRIYVDRDIYDFCLDIPSFSEVSCILKLSMTGNGAFLGCESIVLKDQPVKDQPAKNKER
ncbi:MAG: hypothetical protein HFG37_08575 [Eubacterium sp.]|nr:hypothetical protein [Eubacterium sp.]